MPIEFRCSQCGKMLRTGDDTAGKQAKCPSCGAIQAIPKSASPFGSGAEPVPNLPPPPLGSPFGEPALNPFGPQPPEFETNPYASPAPGSAAFDFRPPSGPRNGPPWERDGRSLSSFVATAKELFGSTGLFFDGMRREGGLGAPLLFALIGGTLGGLGGFCFQLGLQFLLMAATGAPMGQGPAEMAVMFVVVAVLLPIGLIMSVFISAGIFHLVLMMLGGARFPFETTFRVVAYSDGGSALLSLIPFCGGLINGIVSIVFTIIGLSRAHEISGGKAALAVLLPVFVCCGGLVVFYGVAIWFALGGAR